MKEFAHYRELTEERCVVLVLIGFFFFLSIYILDLPIGTPPISYPVQLDLASSDLLLITTLCTSSSCPHRSTSLPSYYPGRSSTFTSLNSNNTLFNLTFSDDSQSSGFLAKDEVWFGGKGLGDQVVGLINQTTMDVGGEGISGIVGLGFPRLSVLTRIGLGEDVEQSSAEEASSTSMIATMNSNSSSTSSSLASTAMSMITTTTSGTTPTTTSTATPTYYPPLLQHLFSSQSTPHLPYPVFSISLSNSSSPFSPSTANASLTLGGVAEGYVLPVNESTMGSGRTIRDIEWIEVVPFASVVKGNDTLSSTSSTTSTASGSATSSAALNTTATSGMTITTLDSEDYLYWALPLVNVTLNGTTVPITPTYNTTSTSHSIALLDIGTNGIYAPQQDVIALFSMIIDARQVSDGQWAVPCDTQMTMTFAFATDSKGTPGRVISLQPSEWMIGQVVGSTMCLAWPVVAPPSADGIDWQLGTPFFRKVYSVFSYGINGVQAPLVGFLPLPSPNQVGNGTATATATATSTSSSADPIFTILSTDENGSTIISSATTTNTTTTTTSSSYDPTNPTPTSVEGISELYSRLTVKIGTTLPNVILPDPTYTTPPYAFETTSIPTLGEIQTIGLANATAWPSVADVVIVSTGVISSPKSGSSTSPSLTGGSSGSNATSGAMAVVVVNRSNVWKLVLGVSMMGWLLR